MASEDDRTMPVFIVNNELPAFDKKPFTTAELCAAAEIVCGFNSIDGAQRIGSLWRIYPHKKESRAKLLVQGLTLRGIQVRTKGQNPFLVKQSLNGQHNEHSQEIPATKLTIGNVPLSFSDEELLQAVKQLDVNVQSKLIHERDRNADGKLTHWKTGRRFLFITVPKEPLQKSVQIGPFKASLYHKEQKSALQQKEAECKKCLLKGHGAWECKNPIKCNQCFSDGHRSGDPNCSLVPQQPENDSRETISEDKGDKHEPQNAEGGQHILEHPEQTEPPQRSRPAKKQTVLSGFRRQGSGSVKRRLSKGSTPPHAGKHSRRPDCSEEDSECETEKQHSSDR